jgi:hypothetical protein
MATTKKVVKTTTTTNASELNKLTKEELAARRKANVAKGKEISEKRKELSLQRRQLSVERKKLNTENKLIRELYKKLGRTKTAAAKVVTKPVTKKQAKKK